MAYTSNSNNVSTYEGWSKSFEPGYFPLYFFGEKMSRALAMASS